MCGLVGMAGNLTIAHDKVFKDLLIVDALRGPHSTGVLTVGFDGGTDIFKAVGDPFQLFDSNKFTKEMKNYAHTVLMGHNRYATVGAVVRKNAHPFECGHIIGAHNGTLTTKYHLDDNIDFEVDSENLYHHMSKHGVQDTVSKAEGALALTWYDDKEETINFLRNDKRPLCYVYSLDMKTIFWASEPWMLTSILDRSSIKHGEVKVFDTYKHYSICLEDESMELKVTPVEKPVPYVAPHRFLSVLQSPFPLTKGEDKFDKAMKDAEGELHKDFMQKGTIEFYVQGKSWDNDVAYIDGRSEEEPELRLRLYPPANSGLELLLLESNMMFKGRIKRVSKEGQVYGLMDLRSITEVYGSNPLQAAYEEAVPPKFPVYNGKEVSQDEWRKATLAGCGWCDEIPLNAEADGLVWVDSNAFVCASCAAMPEVQEVINT